MTLTTHSALDGNHPVGGVEWFEQVVHLYQRRAFLAALGFLRNPEDAREASQEAFARAFKALDRMCDEALRRGANAVITVRFCTSEIMTSAAELLAYGTGVILEKE